MHRQTNNTITDGGVAPQCSFARPTQKPQNTQTHREHIDKRKHLEHKKGKIVERMQCGPNQTPAFAHAALRPLPYVVPDACRLRFTSSNQQPLGNLGQLVLFWDNLGQLWSTWVNLDQLGSTQVNLGQLGSFWVILGQPESTWVSLGQPGSTWVILGQLGSTWVNLGLVWSGLVFLERMIMV